MMQKASKDQDHCQRKNNSDESGVTSCDESGLCQRLENQAANLPNKDATGENSAHKIYPWMKEFRSKGTKKRIVVVGDFCPKLKRYLRKWAEVKNNPFVAKPISVVIF